MLSERQLTVFKCIVDEFIKTAEPVGSKTLIEVYDLPYSSATIRNDMAELENLGYLEKPHTSAGRVPSSKGYKFYVDNLMESKLDEESKKALQTIFDERNMEIDDVIKKCCEILSQMTNLTTMVLGPAANTQELKHIKLFPLNERSAVAVFITSSGHTENRIFQFDDIVAIDDIEICASILNDRLSGTLISNVVEKLNDLEPILAANVKHHEALFQAFINAFINFSKGNTPYISGKNNMLYQPEFSDIEKVRKVMNMLENQSIWRQYEQREKHEKNGVNVSIGDNLIEIDDVSVVSSSFRLGKAEEGKLMVVGPKRMAYDKVIGMMEYMTKTIEELFSDEN
ncbi:MAG: heat-inducible transcription repressor HrcA [Erysipelotrichales bacterium]|nr:heat-inducible transcription repressor HrcA [Erysipelotrichales bacterium]